MQLKRTGVSQLNIKRLSIDAFMYGPRVNERTISSDFGILD